MNVEKNKNKENLNLYEQGNQEKDLGLNWTRERNDRRLKISFLPPYILSGVLEGKITWFQQYVCAFGSLDFTMKD